MLWHPILELDSKLIHGGLPVPDWHGLFCANVPERQVDQFQQRFIARERAAVLGNFTQTLP